MSCSLELQIGMSCWKGRLWLVVQDRVLGKLLSKVQDFLETKIVMQWGALKATPLGFFMDLIDRPINVNELQTWVTAENSFLKKIVGLSLLSDYLVHHSRNFLSWMSSAAETESTVETCCSCLAYILWCSLSENLGDWLIDHFWILFTGVNSIFLP